MKDASISNPANPTPALKPWAVMCCGCSGFLGSKGELITIPVRTGLLQWEGVASFATKEEADAAAKQAGWQTHDTEGPNHRCPLCVHKAEAKPEPSYERVTSVRRGAYVRIPGREA